MTNLLRVIWSSAVLLLLTAVCASAQGTIDTDDGTLAGAKVDPVVINLSYLWNGANWVRATGDATNGLKVQCASGCSSGSLTNNTAAPGATNLGALGFIANAAAPSWTEGRQVLGSTDLHGSQRFTLMDAAGAAVTLSADVTEDAPETNGVAGPKVMSTRRDTPVSSASDSGDNATFNTDQNGLQWTRTNDPCTALPTTTDPISLTADTVIIAATSAKKNYICALVVVAGAAEIVSITEGTGSTCGTSEAALLGSTTDANGASFAANGGMAIGNGAGAVIKGKTTNVDTCLNVSGSNRVSGFVTWVQAP